MPKQKSQKTKNPQVKKPLKKIPSKSINRKKRSVQYKKFHKTGVDQVKKLSLYLILFGFISIILPVLFYLNQTIQLAFFTPKFQAAAQSNSSTPVEISIPAINLKLNIKNTSIRNGVWEIAENSASYLSTSAKPGQKSPIIMYAHNTEQLFGPILSLSPGAIIMLRTSDGRNHLYKINETLEVYPNQIEVFDQKEETLILYTCSGFADLKRFIVIAKPSI
jgi:LPXTG-site transpeptidase (sortase) family protein